MIYHSERGLRFLAWAVLIAIVVMTLGPIWLRPVTALSPNRERLIAYAVLGGLFGIAYPRYRLRIAIILVAIAAALEAAQMLVLTRHATLMGFVWKGVGAVAGVASSLAATRFLGRTGHK